jgi:hypothetical protein
VAAAKIAAVVKPEGVVTANRVIAATSGGGHSPTLVEPNATPHPATAVERPVARSNGAHTSDEVGSAHPAASKLPRVTSAKLEHPKQ